MPSPYKVPQSVLVVVHTPALDVLLLRRVQSAPGQPMVPYWQSVTGSKDRIDENWEHTAVREVAEETGIDARGPGCQLRDWAIENHYDIYPQWRSRYAPGVTRNTERVPCAWRRASTPITAGCPGARPPTPAIRRRTPKPC